MEKDYPMIAFGRKTIDRVDFPIRLPVAVLLPLEPLGAAGKNESCPL